MISTVVEETIETIEKELKVKANDLIANSNTFSQKYRGNEHLDVRLFFLPDDNEPNINIVHLFVGNKDSKILCRYVIKNKELVRIEKRYGNGNKRIYPKYR